MKKPIIKLVVLFMVIIPLISFAQINDETNSDSTSTANATDFDTNSLKKEKRQGTTFRNNLSIHLGAFDPWIGIYYERLVSPYWGFDVAVGLVGGSVGTKVYYPKLSPGKISFYTGISEGILLLIGSKHYIPIGLTYPGKKSLRISLDVGPQIFHDTSEENQIGFSLKVGKSF